MFIIFHPHDRLEQCTRGASSRIPADCVLSPLCTWLSRPPCHSAQMCCRDRKTCATRNAALCCSGPDRPDLVADACLPPTLNSARFNRDPPQGRGTLSNSAVPACSFSFTHCMLKCSQNRIRLKAVLLCPWIRLGADLEWYPATDDPDPGRNGSSLPHMARYSRCYNFSVFNVVKIVIAELFFSQD